MKTIKVDELRQALREYMKDYDQSTLKEVKESYIRISTISPAKYANDFTNNILKRIENNRA